VDLPPSEEVKAITQGDIDAAIVWEPFARQMQEGLGQNAISWPAQSGQDFYWLLVGSENTVSKKSSAIRAVLAALASAEDLVKNEPNEAKRIVAKQVGSNHMPELWETSGFTLSLSRPVILAMEAELTWMNTKQGVHGLKVPDLVDYIHFEALESVNPEKVKTLH
jgi:ABC-type nitrate/sulfonate/bicarbonate transport system substrate-binding protein